MAIILFVIFALVELLFVIGTILVLYHFYGFRVGKSHNALITFFIVGSVVLFLVEFAVFASIDWRTIASVAANYIKIGY